MRRVMARLAVFRSAARVTWGAACRLQHTAPAPRKEERILESPLPGETRIPNFSLTQYLWQDLDRWIAKPAVVCTYFHLPIISLKTGCLGIKSFF